MGEMEASGSPRVLLYLPTLMRSQPLRIAIDTGGTFTDCVWIDPSTRLLRMLKVFSTPDDPSRAIVDAVSKILHGMPHVSPHLRDVGTAPPSNFLLLHGTTVGTNTLLERKGARTALVTTAGFEDAIEIGRQARPRLYDFFFDRVEPLVARELRFGVNERTGAHGEILTSLTSEELHWLSNRLAAVHPESIAISLLFSFANPANETAVADALAPLHLPLSISHQILPEFREYERISTVVINAYLQPILQRYLENLERRASQNIEALPHPNAKHSDISAERQPLRASSFGVAQPFSAAKSARQKAGASAPEATEKSPRIFVMQSSGGITALSTAAREPVRTVLSGPAGGVVGAAATARASGFENIIAFDMGGTSTDVSLVEGEIHLATDAHIAGLPVSVPMLDIHTVGAGGGSLARFDAAGVLRVGPESAGADPGPICYGRGLQPTVTDANLLLGRLQPKKFLGGDFTLDLDRTRAVTREWLKKNKSQLSLEKFAAGVIRVVNATMEKAIRVVSIERGRDPRDFALVAFGGAGGLHACALAEALRIPHVIIPAMPGALSALGILSSDVVKDYSRTVLWRCGGPRGAGCGAGAPARVAAKDLPLTKLNREFAALEKKAADDFRREAWDGHPHYARSIDLRYRGQGYELNLPLTNNLLRDFEREHRRRYGYAHEHREIELVTLRLRAILKSKAIPAGDAPRLAAFARRGNQTETSLGGPSTSQVLFDGKKLRTKIYSREELSPGKKYSGPAILTEYSATSVIPPGCRFHLDRAANLIVYW
jgi:N-methylhydantoinase A